MAAEQSSAASNPRSPRESWNPSEVLDAYFLETRAKLLEIAATLDRVDRAGRSGDMQAIGMEDERQVFIQGALSILQSGTPNRAEQIQRLYSKE